MPTVNPNDRAALYHGARLYLVFRNRTRAFHAVTVSVILPINPRPDASDPHMQNISKYVAALLKRPYSPDKDGVTIDAEDGEPGAFIARELGKLLHQDENAFHFEWL